MRKLLFGILTLTLSTAIFSESISNKGYAPYAREVKENIHEEKLAFAARTNDGKVVSIYKEGQNYIYTYGYEGKPEIEITGIPGKNLFYYYMPEGNRSGISYISFGNKEYRYVIADQYYSMYNSEDETIMANNDYVLQVYKNNKVIAVKQLGSSFIHYNDRETLEFRQDPYRTDIFKNNFDSGIPYGEKLKFSTKGFVLY